MILCPSTEVSTQVKNQRVKLRILCVHKGMFMSACEQSHRVHAQASSGMGVRRAVGVSACLQCASSTYGHATHIFH